MSNSAQLRRNNKQHNPKNRDSKNDDTDILGAQNDVKTYLSARFHNYFTEEQGYYLALEDSLAYQTMHSIIRGEKLRAEFDTAFNDRTIKPDGGILYLKSKKDKLFKKILLVAEIKRQGTNDSRKKEGKKKQALGNAIERLGKNLTGIKAMMNHEKITPFVCFGWGCDFDQNESNFVLAKISMLNEFYYLNKIYVFKKDGNSNNNAFSPVSMYFRREKWSQNEMFEVMKEIAETSFRYYLF